jgi:lipid-binding SYLF domain-containing protein
MTMMKWIACALAALLGVFATTAQAASAGKIDREARRALNRLYEAEPETRAVIGRAAGVLVFPGIYKAGIGIGGEYGEGVLIQGGRSVGYYNVASASIGLQLGAQKRAHIIAFMEQSVLTRFKNSEGWKAGVDGSIVLVDLGASGKADTNTFNKPILGFILGEKGLMYNVTLEGSKITRIHK